MQSDKGSASRYKLMERVAGEARRFVVIFVYLWLMFGLFVLLEAIMARRSGQHFEWSFGLAFFNALVLAKLMLVAENLKLGALIRARPLIVPILSEALLMAVLFIAFHVAEKMFFGLVEGGPAAVSVPHIGGGGLLGLVAVALILFVALVPFFAFKRIGQELGPGRLNALLFGKGIKLMDDGSPASSSV
jgi:hypothetical protein